MLGKLLKYEYKATARTFLPLYAVILLIALANRLFGRTRGVVIEELNQFGMIATIVLIALFIALAVLTIVITSQRFSRNLLGDEGYLMFTLPTTTRKLILSKTIVSVTWVFLSGVVGILTFAILLINKEVLEMLGYIVEEAKYLFTYWGVQDIGIVMNTFIMSVLSYGTSLMVVYFSLSVGQLPKFQKHRTATAFIVFFVVSIVLGWVSSFVNIMIPSSISIFTLLVIMNLISIGVIVLLFEATNYLLGRHLNLE